jgi:hypothetical protein
MASCHHLIINFTWHKKMKAQTLLHPAKRKPLSLSIFFGTKEKNRNAGISMAGAGETISISKKI